MTGRIVLLALILGLASCGGPKKDAAETADSKDAEIAKREQALDLRLVRLHERWATAPTPVKLKLSEPGSSFDTGLKKLDSERNLEKREAIIAELEKAIDTAER